MYFLNQVHVHTYTNNGIMKNGAFTIHTLTLSLTLTTCSLTPTLHSPPQAHTFPNTLTHAAVSMSLIAAGTGVVGLAWGVSHTSRDLVGWIRGRDYWGRARETQVATIMVEALHLTLTRLWDCFTFIYVWDGKSNVSEIWYFFFLNHRSSFSCYYVINTLSIKYAL